MPSWRVARSSSSSVASSSRVEKIFCIRKHCNVSIGPSQERRQEQHVWVAGVDQGQCRDAVSGPTHHLHTGHVLQQRAEARADQRVVVGQEDPQAPKSLLILS